MQSSVPQPDRDRTAGSPGVGATESESGGVHGAPRKAWSWRRPVIVLAAIGIVATASVLFTGSVVMARPAPTSFADLAAKVTPAVVNILAIQSASPAAVANQQGTPMPFPPGSPFDEFFKRFFGTPYPGMPQSPEGQGAVRRMAAGSGFIIDPSGYIVTANHVIENADKIKVTLKHHQTYTAKLIGHDKETDVALLKIDAKKPLPYVKFGNSDKMRPGDWVLAVGNPFGLGGTVTAGIVSARGRDLDGSALVDFLQIDAPINSGNSGGPSFNQQGEVIGVNSAIYTPNGGNVGIGFAIPSNLVKQVVAELRAHGKIARGWLGVEVQPMTKDMAEGFGLHKAEGALIAKVVASSPAAEAGLKPGDIILSWNGKKVERFRNLARLVAATHAKSEAKVVVWRHDEKKTFDVTVGNQPVTVAQANTHGYLEDGSRKLSGTGVVVDNLTPARRHEFNVPNAVDGVVIAKVAPNSAAADQGLRPGDVIESVAQEPVETAREAANRVAAVRKAKKPVITFRVSRGNDERFVVLRFANA